MSAKVGSATGPASGRYRALVLAALLVVYTFNYIDRQILGVLAMSVKADLQLTDAQLGLLGGLAFSLFYSTLALPLAVLADRTSRTWVITLSVAAWSLCTAMCGFAGGFGQLLAARAGVSIGEAGGVAPSHALITSYFPAGSRARAMSIFAVAIPLGSAMAAIFGGYIASTVNWRVAFIVLGLAGVVIAPLFRLIVREPKKPVLPDISVRAALAMLAAKPSFWLISFGAAACTMAVTGTAFWLPSLLQRSFGYGPVGAGGFFGALMLTAGIPGVLIGGWLSDTLGRTDRGAYARMPALCSLAAAPLFAAAVLARTPGMAFLLFLPPLILSYVWLAPLTTSIQHLVPANVRASASAIYMLIGNLIGLGGGSLLLGALSDVLGARFGAESLRYALLAASLLYVVAGLLLLAAARPLRREWID